MTPTNPTPYLIAETAPVFPCWIWTIPQRKQAFWQRVYSERLFDPNRFGGRGCVCTHWLPDSDTAPTFAPDVGKELNRPPIGADIHFTGQEERILVTGHTPRGFTYSGATRLSIPRLGIQGDGTGEAFLDVPGISWGFATPASAESETTTDEAIAREAAKDILVYLHDVRVSMELDGEDAPAYNPEKAVTNIVAAAISLTRPPTSPEQ